MKKLLRHAALGFGLLSGPLLFGHAAPVLSAPSMFSLVSPTEALVISDLDVRDVLNRPVRSSAAHQSFEQLWSSSLTQLLLLSLTPNKLRMYALLQTNWKHAKHFFTQFWFNVQQKILGLLPTSSFTQLLSLKSGLIFFPPLKLRVILSAGFVTAYLSLVISSTRILR